MLTRLVLILMILNSAPVFSRNRLLAPLMPPRERASVPQMTAPKNIKVRLSRSERTALGFEVGTLGYGNNTSGDVANLQLLFGIRMNYIYPLSTRWFLKPSLGYFLKPQSEGEVSITQNVAEAGLGTHYALLMKNSLLWHLGLAQRADYLFSKISVNNSSANTPSSFRYRVGLASGVRARLSPSSDFTFDLEAGVAPFEALKAQTSFTTGLIFFLD